MSFVKNSLKSLAAVSVLVFASTTFAADADMNANANDVALHGYDPVSYFTAGKPTKGSSEYMATFKNAIFKFSNAENRDTFRADPSRYAPQYGGYCAFGASLEKKFDGDPNAWKVVDNKLYLNLNADVQKRWIKDIPGNIAKADRTWPEIRRIGAKELLER
ncbi:YHS domain-containing (seleno)protein [Parendozoicomonas sp. Alg238-R29]|uniref:YHS domain-containing (seleno)protein n=1 Tax=Parendozoicomonas sp. Alg238-R29 TaxID=2993446 RepID=UPI00248F0873|nr:YHS domain-containing (seleno)protein [Parendozoicomonas sp. Alg238-R29]